MTRYGERRSRTVRVLAHQRDVIAETHDREPEALKSANDPIEGRIDRELHGSTVTAVSATKASMTGDSV